MKLRAYILGLTLLSAVTAQAAPLEADQAEGAQEAIELHYITREIYSPVRCTVKETDRTWIFCHHPLNKGSGGLFTADLSEDGKLRVWAVNGKAKQHIGKGGATMTKEDYTPVSAQSWAGESLDIPGALELFK